MGIKIRDLSLNPSPSDSDSVPTASGLSPVTVRTTISQLVSRVIASLGSVFSANPHNQSDHEGDVIPSDTIQHIGAGSIAIGPSTQIDAPPGWRVLFCDTATGQMSVKTDTGSTISLEAGAGGGEANTASNVGASGTGVFDNKTSVDLRFRKIHAASSKVTVTLNSQMVDLDVPDASTSVKGAVQLATDTTDSTAGHALQASDIRVQRIPVVKFKSADETVSASTTLQNDDHLIHTLIASHTYLIHFIGFVDNSGDRGFRFDVSGTATYTNFQLFTHVYAVADTVQYTSAFWTGPAGTPATGGFGTGNVDVLAECIGSVTVNAGGTLLIRWAQESASGVTVLKKGSFLLAQDISQ